MNSIINSSVPASHQDAGAFFSLSDSQKINKQSSGGEKPIGNAAQNRAITHKSGPMLCLAGPGSGKTFTLVQHILFLIREEHISPDRILVLTFSRAAAQEMEERYFRELRKAGISSSLRGKPYFGTFHALFFRILRANAGAPLSLINTDVKTKVLQRLFWDCCKKAPEERDILNLMAAISALKNGTLDALALEQDPVLAYASRGYEEYLRAMHLVDFDDFALSCRDLLVSNPDILQKEQSRFDHILVDEFQDINAVQLEITLLLGARHRNYFVVGDDDQSIYGFRGSDPNVFKKFLASCQEAEQVTLSVNYRCEEPILTAACKVIRENKNRLPKKITAAKKGTRKVELEGFSDLVKETEKEAEILHAYLDQGGDPKDAALILRTHASAQKIAGRLAQLGIPIAGRKIRLPAYLAKIYDDTAGYVRLARTLSQKGSADASLFLAVMNRPQRFFLPRDAGYGLQTKQMLLERIPQGSPARQDMEAFLSDLSAIALLSPMRGAEYLRYQVGLEKAYQMEEGGRENQRIQNAFDAIGRLSAACRDLAGFEQALLQEKARLQSLRGREEVTKEGVQLLTMHACKGLEFSLVILPECNEGILPGRQSVQTGNIEEERRLFYVAMTRAREHLVLHYEKGNGAQPSRFLEPLAGLEKKTPSPFSFWGL
ncbi:MAG: ATP-dependent helicase [Lachnospiraceae bacterium]